VQGWIRSRPQTAAIAGAVIGILVLAAGGIAVGVATERFDHTGCGLPVCLSPSTAAPGDYLSLGYEKRSTDRFHSARAIFETGPPLDLTLAERADPQSGIDPGSGAYVARVPAALDELCLDPRGTVGVRLEGAGRLDSSRPPRLGISCSGGPYRVRFGTPTGTVPADGHTVATVKVVVVDSGNRAVPRFELRLRTSLGRFTEGANRTDQKGAASYALTSDASGVAQVRPIIGDAKGANVRFRPVVAAVKPAAGGQGGGLDVIVGGSGFFGPANASDVQSVRFGTEPAKFSVDGNTILHATAPAGKGTVPVTVTTAAGGASVADLSATFTYFSVARLSAKFTSHPSATQCSGSTAIFMWRVQPPEPFAGRMATIVGTGDGTAGTFTEPISTDGTIRHETKVIGEGGPGTWTMAVTAIDGIPVENTPQNQLPLGCQVESI
jgi:hypothetical protein